MLIAPTLWMLHDFARARVGVCGCVCVGAVCRALAKLLPAAWFWTPSDGTAVSSDTMYLSREAVLFFYVAGPRVGLDADGSALKMEKGTYVNLQSRIMSMLTDSVDRRNLLAQLGKELLLSETIIGTVEDFGVGVTGDGGDDDDGDDDDYGDEEGSGVGNGGGGTGGGGAGGTVGGAGGGGGAKDLFPNCPVSQKYWEKKAKPSKGTLGFKCKRAAKAQAPWLRLELAKGVVENWLTPNQRWSLVLHLGRKRHDRYGDGEATTRWRRRRDEWDVLFNLASFTK